MTTEARGWTSRLLGQPVERRFSVWATAAFSLLIAVLSGLTFARFGDRAAVGRIVAPDTTLRVWWLVCAMLVFLMQVGFLLLETGYVRVRNMSGIAVKSFMMLLASSFVFSILGARVMYGEGPFPLLIGWSDPARRLGSEWLFYQTGFAAISATILSGAIAERTTLRSNVIAAIVVVAVPYPLFGHWVWAPGGWLHRLGMHDFAGSAVVHFVGGVTAFVAAWVAGPRYDKYARRDRRDRRRQEIQEYIGVKSLPLATVGVIFLWIGWMGFNGGNISQIDSLATVGEFMFATCIAASAGGFAVVVASPCLRFRQRRDKRQRFLDFLRSERQVDPFLVLPGVMGGMVAVTACCDLLSSHVVAIPVGALGGLVTLLTSVALRSEFVFRTFLVDDPVDAIAVHAGGGATGTILAGLFPGQHLSIQLLGLTVAAALTLLTMGLVFVLLDKCSALRSSIHEENIGLTFELPSEIVAEFPLKTADLGLELRNDIRSFLRTLATRPVHNFRALAELMKLEQFKDPEYGVQLKEAILGEVAHLHRLARLDPSPCAVSLFDIVQEVCEDARGRLTDISSQWLRGPVRYQMDDPDERYLVIAQRDMVADVVKTLISNSIRSVESHASILQSHDYDPTVVCELRRWGNRISLLVSDNGPGLPCEVRSRLFEPFNKREDGTGFGLGLFYAALVAETFRGQLSLTRSDSRGVTFEFSLHGPRTEAPT